MLGENALVPYPEGALNPFKRFYTYIVAFGVEGMKIRENRMENPIRPPFKIVKPLRAVSLSVVMFGEVSEGGGAGMHAYM